MSDLFADERIQFFLRNRDDIKAWAAIETDVMAATRELLARAQPLIEERLLTIDPGAIVGRHDNAQFERILARHRQWPASVGLALEWSRTVDPMGRNRPKLGVFWWADPPSPMAPRTQVVQVVDRTALQQLGYKVPLDNVWPVGAYASATPDWWRDPEAWLASLSEQLSATWALVAPHIDALLPVERVVSDG